MAKAQAGEARDAIEFLTDDHRRVDKLFRDFESVDRDDPDAVQELVEITCMELQIHSILEEEIFYPAVRSQLDDDDRKRHDLLNEAEVEHETVDDMVAKLQELEPDDAMYAAYFNVLGEYVKHHVKEEEGALFRYVRELALDLEQLGRDMRVRREELFAEMEADEGEADEGAGDGEDLTAELDEDAFETDDEEIEDAQEQVDASRTRH
jgi:hemerythrin superfamily protein